MTERSLIKPTSKDMRCSNCVFGKQLVSRINGKRIEIDDTEVQWVLLKPVPVGTTRNCFSLIEKLLAQLDIIKLNHYINPGEDDTCIYPKRFKPNNQG